MPSFHIWPSNVCKISFSFFSTHFRTQSFHFYKIPINILFCFSSWNLESFVAFIICSRHNTLCHFVQCKPSSQTVCPFTCSCTYISSKISLQRVGAMWLNMGNGMRVKLLWVTYRLSPTSIPPALDWPQPFLPSCWLQMTITGMTSEAMDQAWKTYDTTLNWPESPTRQKWTSHLFKSLKFGVSSWLQLNLYPN